VSTYESYSIDDIVAFELIESRLPHRHADSCDQEACNYKRDRDNPVNWTMIIGRERSYGLNSTGHNDATK
jgi:hypothetical protein